MVDKEVVDISDSSIKERIYSLQNIIRAFRTTLEGYVWTGEGTKYKYTGRPICDTRIIDLLVGLLTPWTNNANLITVKDFQTFNYQQLYFCKEVNKVLYTSPYSKAETYTQVFQIVDDTFQNIADVILGSKQFMRETLNQGELEPSRDV